MLACHRHRRLRERHDRCPDERAASSGPQSGGAGGFRREYARILCGRKGRAGGPARAGSIHHGADVPVSYQVLARKWRPRNFEQLVGQAHVARALVNALDADRLHHAFLFTGTRGVGKTTLARILAKCINCDSGVSSKPCGECSACVEIDTGRFVDLLEVDAASRSKVDETRDLMDNVQFTPARGRYKVYLIDEVHMFSEKSFNALLKTLEEPPPHVKFLLATTDPQKLPITVLSRCLKFNLKRLPAGDIAAHLERILAEEAIEFEASAVKLVARAADGSMRDALSLLDQAIAYGAGTVMEEETRAMLGAVDRSRVIELLDAIAAHDAGRRPGGRGRGRERRRGLRGRARRAGESPSASHCGAAGVARRGRSRSRSRRSLCAAGRAALARGRAALRDRAERTTGSGARSGSQARAGDDGASDACVHVPMWTAPRLCRQPAPAMPASRPHRRALPPRPIGPRRRRRSARRPASTRHR